MEVGPIDETVALNDLLDCCIMYYNEVAHKYVVMVSGCTHNKLLLYAFRPFSQVADLRDNIGTLSDALVDIRLTLDMIPKTSNELRGKFEHRHQVFVVNCTLNFPPVHTSKTIPPFNHTAATLH